MDDRAWASMTPRPGGSGLWEATVERACARVAIRARDTHGGTDADAAELGGPAWTPAACSANGNDQTRIGVWLEKVIFDTQPGPSRNGRHW